MTPKVRCSLASHQLRLALLQPSADSAFHHVGNEACIRLVAPSFAEDIFWSVSYSVSIRVVINVT